MSDTKGFEGGCFCGEVRYSSEDPPKLSSMCHCRMCQRWTGAPAAMTACFDASQFAYVSAPKVFNTSSILERHFCESCGTSLGYRYVVGAFQSTQFVLVGTLDCPEAVDGPQHYFGIEDHLRKWIDLREGLPSHRADENPQIREAWRLAHSMRDPTP